MITKNMLIVCGVLGGLVLGGCSSSSQPSAQPPAKPAAQAPQAAQTPQPAQEQQEAVQKTFETPEAAVEALSVAVGTQDRRQLGELFGPRLKELASGDVEQDDADMQRLAAALQRGYRFEDNGDGGMTLLIGRVGYPFPAPLVKDGARWKFDTDAGIEEVYNRRVGKNEEDAIATCHYYVAAQELYNQLHPQGEKIHCYAMHVPSTPGKRDGLYWQAKEDEMQSPLGPLMVQAVEQGRIKEATKEGERRSYRGYCFKILTQQGPAAKGGQKNYVGADGLMTGGFALVAWPADYGKTGVMTFIVDRDNQVYQTDLGPDTERLAEAITAYNPDKTWKSADEPTTQPSAPAASTQPTASR